MIRRPPRSTLDRSSAASDVYKRQIEDGSLAMRLEATHDRRVNMRRRPCTRGRVMADVAPRVDPAATRDLRVHEGIGPVSYTPLTLPTSDLV